MSAIQTACFHNTHGARRWPARHSGNGIHLNGGAPVGAVCVHHVRVSENVTLAELETLYPGLRGRTGAICTEEFARVHGAIVFNRSHP